jgi:hypothetical protein
MILPDFLFPDSGQPFHEWYFPGVNLEHFHAGQDFIHQFDTFVFGFQLFALNNFSEFADDKVEWNQESKNNLKNGN